MAFSGSLFRFIPGGMLLFIIFVSPLWSQTDTGHNRFPDYQDYIEDPASYIGLTLAELYSRFGPPKSVFPSRGIDTWQDDVVFVYNQGDFYIFKDRVWQAGLKSAMGIKAGDSVGVVSLVLGSSASASLVESSSNSVFYSLSGRSWPLILRCDFDSEGKVLIIFIYRPDL